METYLKPVSLENNLPESQAYPQVSVHWFPIQQNKFSDFQYYEI